ncbi:MAG: hypothetical protein ACRC3B_13475 [Bacteroidia bacterium]
MKIFSQSHFNKTTLLFLSLLSFSMSIYAQSNPKITFTEGEVDKLGGTDGFQEFIGGNEFGMYYYKSNGRNLEIVRLGSDMKVLAKQEIKQEKETEGFKTFLGVYILKEHLYAIFSLQSRKKTTLIFANEIDFQTLTINEKRIELYSGNYFFWGNIGHKISPNSVFPPDLVVYQDYTTTINQSPVVVSEDKQKLLLYLNYSDMIDQPKETIELIVFDNNLNKQWEKKYDFKYSTEEITCLNVKFENNGRVYIVGKYNYLKSEGLLRTKQKKANCQTRIFIFEKDTETPKEIPLLAQDKYLTFITLSTNSGNNLFVTALYSVKENFSASGLYFANISIENGKTEKESMKLFDIEFLSKGLDAFEQRRIINNAKKENEIDLLSLAHFKYTNESFIIIIQHNFDQTKAATGQIGSPGQFYCIHQFLIYNLDNNGNELWKTKISRTPVYEVHLGSYGNGFAPLFKNNQLHLLYCDSPRGVEFKTIENNADTAAHHGIMIATVELSNGSISRSLIYTKKGVDDMTPFTTYGQALNEKTIGICSEKAMKKYKICQVVIE